MIRRGGLRLSALSTRRHRMDRGQVVGLAYPSLDPVLIRSFGQSPVNLEFRQDFYCDGL